jgi:polygalacturonase
MNRAFIIIILALTATPLSAQDTRTVTEPIIPPTCAVLQAGKIGEAETLSPEYEKFADTARIQKAIDECAPGHAVELSRGRIRVSTLSAQFIPNAFLSGALELREGVTLLIDKGVTLYASRDPKDFDPNPGADTKLLCGAIAESGVDPVPQGRPCKPLISISNVKNAAIMGDGTIDGRGGATIIGHDYSWWQMARAAEPKQLRYFSMRLIIATHADGFILYRITLHNSPNFHVSVNNTNGFTAWGVHLQTPTIKSADARNTDGIDPGASTNITIAKNWIDTGDDNVAIKQGTTHISVLDNHFYNGHGMSIGSETFAGDSFLLVDGLTEDHTTSGIRIKSNASRGGLVHDLTYGNICMRDVQIPIAISPFYNNQTVEGFTDPNIPGDRIPDYKNITLQNVIATTPGDVLIAGKDAAHITEIKLDGVFINQIKPDQVHSQFAHITLDGRGTNIKFTGKGVIFNIVLDGDAAITVDNFDTEIKSCSAKFLPMR